MTCLGVIYHIQKDSWSLGAQNPQNNARLLKLFVGLRGIRILMKFQYFWQTTFFLAKWDYSTGGKSVLPVSKLKTGKSQFFTTLVRVFAWIDANTRKRGHNLPPHPPKIGLNHFLIVFLNHIQRLQPIFKILWSAEIWIWKSFSIEFNHEVKGSKFQHKGFLKVLFPHHHPNLSTSICLILFDHRHKTLRVNFSLNLWSRSSKI